MSIDLPGGLNPLNLPQVMSTGNKLAFNVDQVINVKILDTDILKNALTLQWGQKLLQVELPSSPSNNFNGLSGQKLNLKVLQVQPKVVFTVLADRSNSGGMPQNPPLNPILLSLKSAIQANSPNSLPAEKFVSSSNLLTNSNLPVLSTSKAPAGMGVAEALQPDAPASSSSASSFRFPANIQQVFKLDVDPKQPAGLLKAFEFSSGQVLTLKVLDVDVKNLQIKFEFSQIEPGAVNNKVADNQKLSVAPDSTKMNPLPEFVSPEKMESVKLPLESMQRIQFLFDLKQFKDAGFPAASASAKSELLVASSKTGVLDLAPGSEVKVEVLGKGKELSIKFIDPVVLQQKVQELVEQSFKRLLPVQQSSNFILNALLHLRENQELIPNESLPEVLHRLADQILQSLPKIETLKHADSLKSALLDAGIFLEAKLPELLKSQISDFHLDLKFQLLKLYERVKVELELERAKPADQGPASSEKGTILQELLHKTESALAKIVIDQLASVPKEDKAAQVWHLELPYLGDNGAEGIELQIERDQAKGGQSSQEQETWAVTFSLNLPHLGKLHCKLSCLQNTVNTYFRSEQATTLALIENNLSLLKQQLEQAGLKAGFLGVQQGKFEPAIRQKISHSSLFEDKA